MGSRSRSRGGERQRTHTLSFANPLTRFPFRQRGGAGARRGQWLRHVQGRLRGRRRAARRLPLDRGPPQAPGHHGACGAGALAARRERGPRPPSAPRPLLRRRRRRAVDVLAGGWAVGRLGGRAGGQAAARLPPAPASLPFLLAPRSSPPCSRADDPLSPPPRARPPPLAPLVPASPRPLRPLPRPAPRRSAWTRRTPTWATRRSPSAAC
jgi:hypothetical protein